MPNSYYINNFSLLSNLWKFVSNKRKSQFIFSSILMIIGGLLEVISLSAVIPFIAILTSPENILDIWIVAYFADLYEISNPKDLVMPITIIFVSLAIISGIFRTLVLYITTNISYLTGHDLSSEVYWKTLHQPYTTHTDRSTSEIVSAITIKVAGVVATFITFLTLANSVILSSMILITLFVINPLVSSIVIISFSFFYLISSFLSSRILKSNSLIIATNQDKVVKNLQEGLGGIRDVLLDNTQDYFTKDFRKHDKLLKNAQSHNYVMSQTPKFVIETIAICIIALLALFLSSDTSGIVDFLPTLAAMAVAAQRLLPAAQQGYNSWTSIAGSHSSLLDVLKLLEQDAVMQTKLQGSALDFKQSIEFKNISYSYPNSDLEILKDISFKVMKGQKIGIIGETGSGKSTLIDCIMGLLRPISGEIYVDGRLLDARNYDSWMKNIAHVSQNIFLTDASYKENIAFAEDEEDINVKRLKDSAKSAQIHEFIENQSQKYESEVGELGKRISGGQKQRIGIARALYKSSNLLVLDESTSSLDNLTEEKILESIDNLDNDKTIFMIAHRITSLKHADRIFELKDGRIINELTFQELIER
jgi:ABC-type multidrug transport system fused ATPase/permease subunit